MTLTDKFVNYFHFKENNGFTNLIIPWLTKVGQNCFSDDKESFVSWLDSLNKNALYKSLLATHTAMKL